MADTDETTKLVIYGLGIGTVLFFAYLIYKDFTQISSVSRQDIQLRRQRQYGFMNEEPQLEYAEQKSSHLQQIEQKLSQLESKIDNFTKSNNTVTKSLDNPSEKQQRNVVSMSPKPITKSTNVNNRAEFFGML